MAKKKANTNASDARLYTATDVRAAMLIDANKGRPTSDLIGLPGASSVFIGLPIPLGMQILLGASVLPLGLVMELNGMPGSCKTALLYEFGRIFAQSGGYLDMVLTEAKISEELAHSIIGHEPALRRAFTPRRAMTVEQMQRLVTGSFAEAKDLQETKNEQTGKRWGASFPVLIGIDSITGANAEEREAKITKDGAAQRYFAVEANLLAPYIRSMANRIQQHPFAVVYIRHRKEYKGLDASTYAPPTVSKAGGAQLQFQDSFELILHAKKQSTRADTSEGGGAEISSRTIAIRNGKNSFGTGEREMEVPFSWLRRMVKYVENDGREVTKSVQFSKWNWDSALVTFLLRWKGEKNLTAQEAANRRDKLNSICHISGTTSKLWSKTLGMSSSDGCSATKLGRLIQENPEVVANIQNQFSVTRGTEWVGGESDYIRLRTKLIEKAAEEAFDDDQLHYKQAAEDAARVFEENWET